MKIANIKQFRSAGRSLDKDYDMVKLELYMKSTEIDSFKHRIADFLENKDDISPWIDIAEYGLPEFEQMVLWLYQDGFVICERIYEDWDEEYLQYFLGGYGDGETRGRIVAWMPTAAPDKYLKQN